MGRARVPAVDRVLARCVEEADGCWGWTGPVHHQFGYPISVETTTAAGERARTKPYRITYEYFIADVPPGLQIDHLCRNRRCCNPWHLEPVTARVNTLRSQNPAALLARRDRCAQGHLFNPENTRIRKDRRECVICARAKVRRWRARRRDEVISTTAGSWLPASTDPPCTDPDCARLSPDQTCDACGRYVRLPAPTTKES